MAEDKPKQDNPFKRAFGENIPDWVIELQEQSGGLSEEAIVKIINAVIKENVPSAADVNKKLDELIASAIAKLTIPGKEEIQKHAGELDEKVKGTYNSQIAKLTEANTKQDGVNKDLTKKVKELTAELKKKANK